MRPHTKGQGPVFKARNEINVPKKRQRKKKAKKFESVEAAKPAIEARVQKLREELLLANSTEAEQKVLEGPVDRASLLRSLDLAVKQGIRHKRRVTLMAIGLHRVKGFDAVRSLITARLLKVVRDSDLLGYLGHESFGVLICEHTDEENIKEIIRTVAYRMETVFKDPLEHKGTLFHAEMAIGVSVFPYDAATGRQVLRNAETALSEALEIGKIGLNYFKEGF